MGGVGGVILAHRGRFNHDAGKRILLYPGNKVNVYILGKNIFVGLIYPAGAEAQLIKNTSQVSGFPSGQISNVQNGHSLSGVLIHGALALDLKCGTHLTQQLLGIGKLVRLLFLGLRLCLCGSTGKESLDLVPKADFRLRLRLIHLCLLGLGSGIFDPFIVHCQASQSGEGFYRVSLLVNRHCKIRVIRSKGKGGCLRNRQIVRPLHSLLPGNFHQLQKDPVSVVLHGGCIQRHLIDHFVGNQDLPIPVQNLTPGGLYGLLLGNFVLCLPKIFLAVVDLQVIERRPHAGKHKGQQQYHDQRPALKLFGIHKTSFPEGNQGNIWVMPASCRLLDDIQPETAAK